MKKYTPLDGLRWSRNSDSALNNMPQTDVLGRAGGGEPTMNADFIIEFAKLIPKGWKLTIETSLKCSCKTIESLAPYVAEWIVDIKDTNVSIYEKYTGVSSEIIQQLYYIKEFVPVDKVIVKVPHIPHFNTHEDVKHSIEILKGIGIMHIKEITYMKHITK